MKRSTQLSAALGMAAVAAFAVFALGPRGQSQPHARRIRSHRIPVLTARANKRNVPVYLNGVGTVLAYQSVTVRPQITGKIVSIDFKEGKNVKKGQLLAQLNDETYKADLEEAKAKLAQDQAQLANYRVELRRYQRLAKTNYASKQQADSTRASVLEYEAKIKSDHAAIDGAQATLDYTQIRAPISGRAGLRQVDVGNIISTTDAQGLVVINQLRPISVVFTLPSSDLIEVREAASKAVLPVLALASDSKTILDRGKLAVIDNQVESSTGTIKLKATFPNEQLKLWPDQFVNIRLRLRTLHDTIVVPSTAVQQGPNGAYVYRVGAAHKAHMQPVRVLQENQTQAVIGQGVSAGDQVVTSGFDRLTDGAKVAIGNKASSRPRSPEADAVARR